MRSTMKTTKDSQQLGTKHPRKARVGIAERLNPERRDRRPTRLKAATAGMIEEADVNRQRALELRLPPHRLSYRSIARKLGVSVATAHHYVNSAHADLLADISEKKTALRHLENETVDALIERWLPVARAVKNSEVGLRALDRVIKLIDQKCRINGLYSESSAANNNERTIE